MPRTHAGQLLSRRLQPFHRGRFNLLFSLDRIGPLHERDVGLPRIIAPRVVVAAGATETPPLLRRSGLGKHPSLVILNGNNENVWGHVEWGWGPRLEGRTWGERYLWLRLWGPGRVAVQSAFTHMEESANNLYGVSNGTTRHQW